LINYSSWFFCKTHLFSTDCKIGCLIRRLYFGRPYKLKQLSFDECKIYFAYVSGLSSLLEKLQFTQSWKQAQFGFKSGRPLIYLIFMGVKQESLSLV